MKVEVVPYTNRAYRYIIEVSTNGINYTTVVDRSTNTTGSALLTDTFSEADARYVKITVVSCYGSTSTWASINELRAFGY